MFTGDSLSLFIVLIICASAIAWYFWERSFTKKFYRKLYKDEDELITALFAGNKKFALEDVYREVKGRIAALREGESDDIESLDDILPLWPVRSSFLRSLVNNDLEEAVSSGYLNKKAEGISDDQKVIVLYSAR